MLDDFKEEYGELDITEYNFCNFMIIKKQLQITRPLYIHQAMLIHDQTLKLKSESKEDND